MNISAVLKTTVSVAASTLLLASSSLFASCTSGGAQQACDNVQLTDIAAAQQTVQKSDNTRIQVAILLDTSNSMDGLIEQAKSRLWNIVNILTTLRYGGKEPQIEIALYEYGNDGLSAEKGYIRQVASLTTDLDLISEKLFALRTNGGQEYCGAVIQEAVRKLEWGSKPADMKLVYIAGNEPFNQGRISYKEAIASAVGKDIFVNTIHCGGFQEGVNGFWRDGAIRGKGKYFNIDSDRKVRFIETPYDREIEACNKRINDTYISYGGSYGESKKASQLQQDQNAKSLSSSNYAERAVSKSKTVYKNDSWDMVDKMKEDKDAIRRMKEEEMPAEFKGKSKQEVEQLVQQKAAEREKYQKEMTHLAKKRQAYIDVESKKSKSEDDLGDAISASILTIAKEKGYKAE